MGVKDSPSHGSLHKCFSLFLFPFLFFEELLKVCSIEEMFDRGSGPVVMRGSHLVVNGMFGGKRSPISVFVPV